MDNKRLAQVLIIKPSSMGDIIHALPVAAGLKAAMPGVSIDWVAAKGYEGLLSGNPAVRRVITFDRRMFKDGGGPAKLIGFVRELRREKYDLVIDLQGLLRSALMAFSCRAGRRLGLSDAREGAPFFYTETVRVP
ncbi:MAG TPA: glycosyltransferase family 9 protein, partial [Nitrospirota bacterium]|nr:glycosyltransferase family 9 protein [Nitrospirota bacterium]